MPSHDILVWEAHEYEKKEKGPLWYPSVALFLGGFILYAIFTDNPIVAVTFILVGVVGYLFLQKNPERIEFALTPEGVRIENQLHLYENMHSYWIFEESEDLRYISFHTNSMLLPRMRIPFEEEVDPAWIRSVLKQYLPEKKQERGFVDILHDLF